MTAGTYNGFTYGFPRLRGIGGGIYTDDHGNLYPQFYYGKPGFSASSGYSNDLENFLTGPSVSGTIGKGKVGPNVGTSGGASGGGIGTRGAAATYGFGPYNPRNIGDSFRPRTDEFGQPFPGSEIPTPTPGNNSPSQGTAPASSNPVLKFFDSFRPRTDEFGNPFPGQQSSGGVLKYGEGAPPTAPDSAELVPDPAVDLDPASEASATEIRRLGSRVVRLA